MLKPHGDAILPDDKRYFIYENSRARLVTEGALGRLKIKFRVLSRKCESKKETSTYMVWPALCFITFVLKAVI